MSNMMTRALSGAVYVALLSLCLYLGSWFWMALLTVLFLLACFEYFKAQQPESGFLEHCLIVFLPDPVHFPIHFARLDGVPFVILSLAASKPDGNFGFSAFKIYF